jgi:hypothetical protein
MSKYRKSGLPLGTLPAWVNMWICAWANNNTNVAYAEGYYLWPGLYLSEIFDTFRDVEKLGGSYLLWQITKSFILQGGIFCLRCGYDVLWVTESITSVEKDGMTKEHANCISFELCPHSQTESRGLRQKQGYRHTPRHRGQWPWWPCALKNSFHISHLPMPCQFHRPNAPRAKKKALFSSYDPHTTQPSHCSIRATIITARPFLALLCKIASILKQNWLF